MARPKGSRGTSSTGAVVAVRADQSTWRDHYKAGNIKFDDDAKERYLKHFSQHGLKMEAAKVAGVTLMTVHRHLKNDPQFAEAFAEAQENYRDQIAAEVRRRGVDGWDEPIYHKGERATDFVYDENGHVLRDLWNEPIQRVAAIRKFSDVLLVLEAKRVDPSYKERVTLEGDISPGVMVAPPGMDPEDWVNQQETANETREAPAGIEDT